jgi:excisionase family DNA binding protein
MSNFYTCKEVADIFKVKVDTIRDWVRDGKIAAIQFGKRDIRISQEAIDSFIRANSTTPN